MKQFFYILTLLSFIYSCEEVIDVTLSQEPPKLVVDASLNWIKGTTGNEQIIKLTLTAAYFDDSVPAATGAQIQVTDPNNIYDFIEDGNTGIYKNNTFLPTINETYTITILYKGETYVGSETMKSVATIDYVEQKNDGGFSGNETELKAYYKDPADEENYYLFEFKSSITTIPSLEVYKDEFTNGNEIFGFYAEEDLKPGDIVTIKSYGISKRFYNFMFLLLQQNSQENGGPFETQPATVRGNCINLTNPNNYPLGYFRVSEVDEYMYTLQ